MPFFSTGGASNITGADVVDKSLSLADFSDATVAALRPTALTLYPRPIHAHNGATDDLLTLSVNTTMYLGLVHVESLITVNQLTFSSMGTVTTPGTIKIALFSEDGQTQLFSVTSDTISAINTQYKATIGSVAISPGNYWLCILANGTFNGRVLVWGIGTDNAYGGNTSALGNVTGKPTVKGTYTVTASTIPATLTIASIATNTLDACILKARFDN